MAVQINQISINNNILDANEQQLIASREMTRFFGSQDDFVQFFVYNNVNTLLNQNLNFKEYTVNTNSNEIVFDPEKNILDYGYRVGTYTLQYNFLRPIVSFNPNLDLFIQSISSDRTELRISSTVLSNDDLYDSALNYITLIQQRSYFIEFYLDLGNNKLIPASSLAVERDINENTSILIKLFDPLPDEFLVNFPLNLVEKVVDTQAFQAVLTTDIIETPLPSLRQANFSIDVDNKRIGSSDYYNYDSITQNSGSNQILNYISQSLPQINIDYSNYEQFVHFSSATQRLESFKNKLEELQSHQNYIDSIPSTNLDYITYQNKINNIIQNFDGYEKHLYYDNDSTSWPKSNTTKPYINYPTTASQAISWYNFQYTSASYYDEFNNDNLVYGLPIYIQEKNDFEYVKPFIHSMGHLFDDIWVYIKSFTDLWKAQNKLTEGISKDLVSLALESLGISLYTDGDQDDLNLWLNGMNSDGTFTFQTSSFQKVDTVVTASQYTLSGQDEAKSIFKRIYHNLPTLLKSKGSSKFVNYFSTLYGTPETILFPHEYGGVDKTSDVEYVYSKYTYGVQFETDKYIILGKSNPTLNYGFNSLEFRFNPNTFTTSTQTLLSGLDRVSGGDVSWGVVLNHSSSNGYDYGVLDLVIKDGVQYVSSSVSLPFYVTGSDGKFDWWNVIITEPTPQTYTLSVQNSIGDKVGFTGSSNITTTSITGIIDNSNNTIVLGSIPNTFSGNPINITTPFGTGVSNVQIQEVRGWNEILNQNTIDVHTLNPESYIGNTTSSTDNLLFRFPLGNDLKIPDLPFGTTYGVQPIPSLQYYINHVGNWSENDYKSFTETYYSLPAVGGYSTPNTTKIRIENERLATNKLYPYQSVVYPHPVSSSRTLDIHQIQTGLSPQDQINNDIIAHLGDTYNLDNIIGDPSYGTERSYKELTTLQNEYFKKYITSYNYKDFVQLIDTFHKSIWRYLSESVPGRSSEATGLVIKPHILERSKVQRFEPTLTFHDYSGSIKTGFITGSNPGGYCCSRNSPLNEAFIDGEFSGSIIDVQRYFGKNEFTDDLCDCKQYEVETNRVLLYTNCKGGISVLNNGGTYNVLQVFACNPNFVPIFPSPGQIINVKELTKATINNNDQISYFKQQYGGFDPLDNNVTSSLLSQYKFKEVKQPNIPNLNKNCNTCRTFEIELVSNSILTGQVAIDYFDCFDPISPAKQITGIAPGFLTISSCTYPTVVEGTANITLIGTVTIPDTKPQPSYFEPVEFNDSVLTNTAYKRSRYDGMKLTSNGFNLPLTEGSIPGSGSQTNINYEQSYIAFSDWAGNSLAENYGTSNFHIKYLIDESGSVFKPEYSSSYYWNTDQNFGADYPVNITIYNGSGSIGQDYETTIYRPLKRFNVVAHSESGSNGNILNKVRIPTMVFETTISGSGPDKFLYGTFPFTNYFLYANGTNVIETTYEFSKIYYSSSFITSYSQVTQGNGFSEPLPFKFNKYDEIRIEGEEIYTILSSSLEPEPDMFNPKLYIFVDRPVPNGQKELWSVRRLVDDPGFIMINNDPSKIEQTGKSPSFIIPKYLKQSFKNNLTNVINKLYKENLI